MRFIICLLLFALPAMADLPTTVPTTRPAFDGDQISVTEHEILVRGEPLRYRASAGTMLLKDEAGKPQANFFFVAYDRQPEAEPSERPVTFVFNGGPGAAAVWLHLGTAGPMRIDLNDDGLPGPPPFKLAPNEDTWLAATDLVFIDPVSTGFSRAAEGVDPKQFFGVQEDVQSVGQFIRLYLTRYERWASPVFVAGESYGTTRGAALSEHLLERYGIVLNGLILVSSILDFSTVSGDAASLPEALFLPTYFMTAAHHARVPEDLRDEPAKHLGDLESWSINEYLPALAMGDQLPADRRAEIIKQLERYTGLDAQIIDRANLRISPGLFQKNVLGDPRKVVGRFDGRVTGTDPEPLNPWPSIDPSYSLYFPVYSGSFNAYVRRDLNFRSDLPYEVISARVQPWNWERGGRTQVDVTGDLSDAMRKNPHMKVLFASGYHDIATPFFATDYTIRQLDLPPELRKNIEHLYYPGGHMMYHLAASRRKLGQDVGKFIEASK